MMSSKQAITSHYIGFLGVPTAIERLSPITGVGDLAVMTFDDEVGRWAATNGLYEYVQGSNGKLFGTELVVYANDKTTKVVRLLEQLSRFIVTHQLSLYCWDTIECGASARDFGVPYNNLMLIEPYRSDEGFGGVVSGFTRPLIIHQVVGLSERQMKSAKAGSTNELLDEILAHSLDERLAIDDPRNSSPY